MRKGLLAGLLMAIIPVAADAQAITTVDPAYRRAQTLVNDGNAAAGRALVDSMVALAVPGTPEYAEAIYWRAVLAATAAEAEMDYRRIVVDYPRSPRAEDSLIRLAQLEMARGNYDGALRHLNRFVLDYPESSSRARAGYWTARALFDKNDIRGACVATADALGRTSPTETELRNQITYLNQRCAGIVLTPPADSAASVPVAGVPATVPAPPAVVPPSAVPPSAPPATAPPPSAATPPQRDTTRAVPPVSSTVNPPASAATRPSPGVRPYSVQVAAYNVKSQADAMVARLKRNGYDARVDGTAAPFRVRIGSYATQAQASAVQRSLKAKQIEGFVVQADTR